MKTWYRTVICAIYSIYFQAGILYTQLDHTEAWVEPTAYSYLGAAAPLLYLLALGYYKSRPDE